MNLGWGEEEDLYAESQRKSRRLLAHAGNVACMNLEKNQIISNDLELDIYRNVSKGLEHEYGS